MNLYAFTSRSFSNSEIVFLKRSYKALKVPKIMCSIQLNQSLSFYRSKSCSFVEKSMHIQISSTYNFTSTTGSNYKHIKILTKLNKMHLRNAILAKSIKDRFWEDQCIVSAFTSKFISFWCLWNASHVRLYWTEFPKRIISSQIPSHERIYWYFTRHDFGALCI